MKRLSSLTVAMFAATMLVAQPPAQQPPRAKPAERLAQFKKLKLIETLDLDEKTAEKFFVRYNEGQKKIDQARHDLRTAIGELEAAIRANVSDAELTAKTQAATKALQQLSSATLERLESVRSLLNPQQYAKLVVFEVRFIEGLQRAMLERQRPPLRERDRRRVPPLEEPD
ncbi:hypothetical protein HRbin20_01701 [bacterium HR20]|nr:hypothetical protein HRbin20_01701 [bacterium HR20]